MPQSKPELGRRVLSQPVEEGDQINFVIAGEQLLVLDFGDSGSVTVSAKLGTVVSLIAGTVGVEVSIHDPVSKDEDIH